MYMVQYIIWITCLLIKIVLFDQSEFFILFLLMKRLIIIVISSKICIIHEMDNATDIYNYCIVIRLMIL